MLEYLQAENLKCRRTFVKKLIFLAPMVTLLIGCMSGKWFQANAFNWWYTMILPGYISLITALVDQIEQKKLHYRAVFALPVSLKKVWISKVLVIGIYVSISSMILLVGILMGSFVFSRTVPFYRAFFGFVLIAVTCLWQIPFCLFLSKKLGLLWAVLLNSSVGIILEMLTSITSMWWACPYSWTARMMCPVLGFLPNGLLAEAGDPLLNPAVIFIGLFLSIGLFAVLLMATANWFQKQEVN